MMRIKVQGSLWLIQEGSEHFRCFWRWYQFVTSFLFAGQEQNQKIQKKDLKIYMHYALLHYVIMKIT